MSALFYCINETIFNNKLKKKKIDLKSLNKKINNMKIKNIQTQTFIEKKLERSLIFEPNKEEIKKYWPKKYY